MMKEVLLLPPQNLEAEQAVLGAVLIDHRALDRVVPLLKPDCFYKDAHNYIYAAMLDLHRRGEPVDSVTLTNLLHKRGKIEKAGGAYYLTGLVDALPSAANVEHYAEIVREKWIDREIIRSCDEVKRGIYQEGMDRSEAETILTGQFGKFDIGTGPVDLTGTMAELRGEIEASLQAPGKIQGRKTGFVDLDKLTCGLGDEDLVIIGGRPSMGKTSLALDITRYVARGGDPVLWFSIESSISQITRRLVLQESRVDGHRLRGGYLSQDEAESLEDAAGVIEGLPVLIDDRASQSMENIHSIARRTQDKKGLALVVIDYLQRMGGNRPRGTSRTEELEDFSRRAKQIAKELRVNVVLVSQLSRAPDHRPKHRPTMADLRDSGGIEQEADHVWLLYRQGYYKDVKVDESGAPVGDLAELEVGKHRNGPTGTVRLRWNAKSMTFDNYSKGDELPF